MKTRSNTDRRAVIPDRRVGALENYPVQSCVYVPTYKFKKCEISSCKNWSSVTKTSCLAIDRVQPIGNKVISDAEIHLFKFSEAGVTGRLVSAKRKRAVTRVKCILTLHAYLVWIRGKFTPEVGKFYRGKHVEKAELEYPLRISKVGFKNWMWPYLVDPEVYKQFLGKKEGECTEIELYHMLDMTDLKLGVLAEQVKNAGRSQTYLKNEGQKNERNNDITGTNTRRLRSV